MNLQGNQQLSLGGQGLGGAGQQSGLQMPQGGLQFGQLSQGSLVGGAGLQNVQQNATQLGGGLQLGHSLQPGTAGLQQQQVQLGLGGLGGGGGLQIGKLPTSTAQTGGIQLGLGQLGGLGQTSTSGLQLGQPQLGQATSGLQIGQKPLGLGQPVTSSGGFQAQLGGLGQTAGQLQLGQGQLSGLGQTTTTTTGGFQLGQIKPGGLGQTTGSVGGVQLGQPQLGGLGQTVTTSAGLQLGQNPLASVQTVGGTGGLQLGQLGNLGQTATSSGGFQLSQGLGKTTSSAGGLQMGQQRIGGLGQTTTASSGGGLQLGGIQQTSGLQSQLGQGALGQTQLGNASLASGGLQLGGGLKLGQSTASITAGVSVGGAQVSAGVATSSSGLTLVATSSNTVKPGLSLGLPQATTTAIATSLSGGLKLGGLTGGLPGPSTTTQATLGGGSGLSLGGGTKLGVSLGGGGASQGLSLQGKTSTALGLGTSTATTSVTTTTAMSKGLGGVDPNTATTNGGTGGSQSLHDTPLPEALEKLVNDFKDYLKKQKQTSDQFNKFSDACFKEVNHKTATQTQALSVVSSEIQMDSAASAHLKEEISLELQNAEVAQRTMELPAGLQHENTAPDLYFHNLVSQFEAKMELYRREIEELESHLMVISPETGMSSQTIVEILRLQYKPFLLLAAQLQTTHEQVQNLKEQYLSYRKVFQHNSTDVFEERRRGKSKLGPSASDSIIAGPPPFSVTALNQPTAQLASSSSFTGGAGLAGNGFRANPLGGIQPTGSGIGLGTTGTTGLGLGLGLGKTGTGLSLGSNTLGGGLSLGLGQTSSGGTTGLAQASLSLGSSLSQPSLGFPALATSTTAPATALPGTQSFNLQMPPLGKRKGNTNT